jgi:hemoglobin
MSDPTETLFERLGGEAGVNAVVRDMYRRVFDDPELQPFFTHVDSERLQRMQYQFMSSVLDGPVEYTGAELNAIHKGRGITGKHFAKFFGHLAEALEAHGASDRDVDLALGRIATYKDKITGDANVDG